MRKKSATTCWTSAGGRTSTWSSTPSTSAASSAGPPVTIAGATSEASTAPNTLEYTTDSAIDPDKGLQKGHLDITLHVDAASGGFVATSQWLVNPRRDDGCNWEPDATMSAPIRQEAQLLKRGESSAAARAFLSGDPDTDGSGAVETDEAEAAAEAEGDTIAELMGAGDNPEMEAAVEEQTFEELTDDVKDAEPEAEEAKR